MKLKNLRNLIRNNSVRQEFPEPGPVIGPVPTRRWEPSHIFIEWDWVSLMSGLGQGRYHPFRKFLTSFKQVFVLAFFLSCAVAIRAEDKKADKKVDNDMSVLEDEPVVEKKEPAWKELLKRLDQKMEEARKKKSQQPVGGTTNAMAVRGKEKTPSQGQPPQERLRFKGIRNAASKSDAPRADLPKASAPEDKEMKDLQSTIDTVKMGDSKKSEDAIGDFEKKHPNSAWKIDLETIQKSLQE